MKGRAPHALGISNGKSQSIRGKKKKRKGKEAFAASKTRKQSYPIAFHIIFLTFRAVPCVHISVQHPLQKGIQWEGFISALDPFPSRWATLFKHSTTTCTSVGICGLTQVGSDALEPPHVICKKSETPLLSASHSNPGCSRLFNYISPKCGISAVIFLKKILKGAYNILYLITMIWTGTSRQIICSCN